MSSDTNDNVLSYPDGTNKTTAKTLIVKTRTSNFH